jgi:hypothetical protein
MTSSPIVVPDRRLMLLRPDAGLNGVDFAEIRHDHRGRLDVHFINRVRVQGSLARDRAPVTLTGGGHPPELCAHPAAWSTDTSGRPVLHVAVEVPAPGSRYTLTVLSDRVDPCFRSAAVIFPGRDDGDIDCLAAPSAGPAPAEPAVPIDYLAKDFASFCQALSNFSAARYPQWAERSEADLGVVLMELLSALADELSYLQDRIAAEAVLDTATQRLSLVQHARLVDYQPVPALAATTVMQFDVAQPLSGVVQCQGTSIQGDIVQFVAGTGIPGLAAAADGTVQGSAPGGTGTGPQLDPRWNRYRDEAGSVPRLVPYLWDQDGRCLPRGALGMWISGHDHGFHPGQELLIDTAGPADGDPPVREVVRLAEVTESTDPVGSQAVTHIRWADGLVSEHDLTRTQVVGNLVPAMQGQIAENIFMIPGSAAPSAGPVAPPVPLATVRTDHAGAAAHCLFTLTGPVAWRFAAAPDGGPAQSLPALELHPLSPDPAAPAAGAGGEAVAWHWVPRLLDNGPTARCFTLTSDRYSPARTTADPPFYDYDGDGTTIRFGDGTFGLPPAPGTMFRARYLAGGGGEGNVAADTIVSLAAGEAVGGLVWRCTNPFAASGGVDAETRAQIRDRAPQQIKAGLLSLTGTGDYQAAALSFLPPAAVPSGDSGTRAWARQAAAAFRWTGSWVSALTLVDPATAEPAATQLSSLAGLAELLNARRLAGSDSAVALARYRWLDLRITCRAKRAYRRNEVAAAVIARLDPRSAGGGVTGFFGRDQWAFGQALDASALIAAVQSCPGVAGVDPIQYRGKPEPARWRPLPPVLRVAPGEILRIDNDRDRPQHGLLFVEVEAAQ